MLQIILFSVIGLAHIGRGEPSGRRITVVFNNISDAVQLQTGWGFSCVVEGFGRTILFDTGCDGKMLISNMEHLGINPASIDMIILSHMHADHTGGLEHFLRQNHKVTVVLPRSFGHSFVQQIKYLGADVLVVSEPTQLLDGVYSTGEMGDQIKEQALILETSKGLVIITGCAHPGLVNIVKLAGQYLKKNVYLTMGGFHLMGLNALQVRECLQTLKALHVKKVAPSHCTGEAAIASFRQSWGEDFLAGGCGAVIEVDGSLSP